MALLGVRPPLDDTVLTPPPWAQPANRRPSRRVLWMLGAVAIVALVAGIVWWQTRSTSAPLATATVSRGTLVQTVTATGTVSARDTINVGTQVSGTLSALFVDYNSRVHVGQVLAKIDPSTFAAAVARDRAQLAQAQSQAAGALASTNAAGSTAAAGVANVAQAQATYGSNAAAIASADAQIAKAKSALDVAALTVKRDNQLIASGFISQSQVDADRSSLAAAQAGLSAAQVTAQQARLTRTASQAALSSVQAQSQASGDQTRVQVAAYDANQAAVDAARAQLDSDLINLDRTVITSPVNGTVISRNVSIGQTVAASFQTPTLFTIAQDLGQMELDLSVGEPDIGSIAVGNAIDFSVLAYPSVTFHSTVAEVRKNPTTVNNVVTYTVVAYVANSQGKLFPGMTANASVHVAKAQNALIVPLAALQWTPSGGSGRRTHGSSSRGSASAGANVSAGAGSSNNAPGAGSAWGQTDASQSRAVVAGSNGRVFVADSRGATKRARVAIQLVTAGSAAVTSSDGTLQDGDQVVVGYQSSGQSASASVNPFSGPPRGGGLPRGAR